MLASCDGGEFVKVVNDVFEVQDECRFAVGAPMSQMIVGIHHGTLFIQCSGDMPVSPTVLCVSVDHLHDKPRLLGWIPTMEEDTPVPTLKLRFKHQHLLVVGHST
jgi:hypothetical protein